ncbi:phytanoyl-CoA dioxygenase family protein [Streptomyces sp. HC307]|uniref:phytanoyl-CoA dioxygenase family protein n=1 Tax=Streptomyces flavusporus TaxID=3385496 RepID=UPI003916F509
MDVSAVAAETAERGFALVPGFLTGAHLDQAVAGIEEYFPDPEGDTDGFVDVDAFKHAVPFPFSSNALNRLPLDPRVIDVAELLLGTEDLLLTSSFAQAKYGTAYGGTHDQSLHNDTWAVNSLLPPRTDGAYQRLFGIVYLTDVTADTAPTYVAGRADDLGVPLITSVRKATYSSTEYPALYERERPVEAAKGSLLLFTGDLVHRGSAYRARHGRRLALFFNIHGGGPLGRQAPVGDAAGVAGLGQLPGVDGRAVPEAAAVVGVPGGRRPLLDRGHHRSPRRVVPGHRCDAVRLRRPGAGMTVGADPAVAVHDLPELSGYGGRAVRGLTYLGRLFDLGPGFAAAARDAVAVLFGG